MGLMWATLYFFIFIASAALLYNQIGKRTLYSYSSLRENPDSIRLLRLLPNKDETADIQCQLFDYPLDLSEKNHLYEALSYVWGDPNDTESIFIGEHPFAVTKNLRKALRRLRNHSIERILWVDAICINQKDKKEKEDQIERIANIYNQASRVIVWLGDALINSDQAFKYIRIAAEDKFENSPSDKTSENAVFDVLKLPWFRRIWVLQEVAAARRILIICGLAEITGYAFCLGLNNLKLPYETHPELQSLIPSMTHLIRGAIFRPQYRTNLPGRASLGELIDMYHTREATILNDKLYALLGMSSDDFSAAGLSPNYTDPWKEVLQKLVIFLLSEKVSVEVRKTGIKEIRNKKTGNKETRNKEIAVVKSNGYILGQVSSVKGGSDRHDTQHVEIEIKIPESSDCARWILHVSAKSIRQGDLVCVLEGAPKPTIIRTFRDYSTIIMIAVTPRQRVQYPSASMKDFPRKFLLVWDLEKALDDLQNQVGYEAWTKVDTLVPKYLMASSSEVTGLYDVALILKDSGEYEEAGNRLQELIEGYEDYPRILAIMEDLALTYNHQQKWKEAEELFFQVIQTRKRFPEMNNQNLLNSIANLASSYVDQARSDRRKPEMTDLLNQIRGNRQIPAKEMAQVARSFDQKLLMLLLDLRQDKVTITRRVFKAAAGNEESGQVMAVLLERSGNGVRITDEVIKAVVGNKRYGEELMTLLLERTRNNIPITEEIAKIAAGNLGNGKEVMALLLERKGNDVPITEAVVEAAAGNMKNGKEVMALLFERRENDIPITEGVFKAAAGNEESGQEVMGLLLERGGDALITEEVVKAAARNMLKGKEVMALLLERRKDILITEGVVEAVETNWVHWEVMTLLLERGGDDIRITEEAVVQIARLFDKAVMGLLLKRGGDALITEEVIEAAARNKRNGEEVMALLLERRMGIIITEGLMEAAAGNEESGREVMELLLAQKETAA